MRPSLIFIALMVIFSANGGTTSIGGCLDWRDASNSNKAFLDDSLKMPTVTSHSVATIDSLQIGKKYFIKVESVGCFHHSELKLTITRKVNGYYADFKMMGKIEGQKVNRTYKTIKLEPVKLDSILSFERQLIQVAKQTFNCTTVDTYYLSNGRTKNVYKTDNCDWQGIGRLVGYLFRE